MAYGTVNADKIVNSDGITSGGLYGFKNRIINGAMMIDQRNAGASVTPSNGQYSLDRWSCVMYANSSKYTAQQNAGSVTPPAGFKYYLGITSSSAYAVGTSDDYDLRQYIEGYNVADLGWGAVGASSVTLSFWVRSSLTGTFGGAIANSAFDRSYPFTYTISSANTWEQKSVTIPGDTTGTWLTTSGIGMRVIFGLGVGTTYSGAAGAWGTTTYTSATGAVSVVGTNGATWYITGVQLEKGSTATSFDYRPYGTELALCQRYYFRNQGGETYGRYGVGVAGSTTNVKLNMILPVPLRASSTTVDYSSASSIGLYNGGGIAAMTSITPDVMSKFVAVINVTVASGLTAGGAYEVVNNNNASGYIGISAEL